MTGQVCYCGDRYRCEDCRNDVCFCTCEKDGAPMTREEVTASGHVNPSIARQKAWEEKLELTR
ncbi:hypothetical protein ACIPY0_12425 [Paenarthrobacter nicotinovorans]|uniref:hypothetical protein n=1 Tax=Paenarthrobacter nicotinovorans TaxID=29320 RepID=UPI00382D05C1